MTEFVRPEAEFLLYQTEDGHKRVEVRFDGETTWLIQAALAELYQTTGADSLSLPDSRE